MQIILIVLKLICLQVISSKCLVSQPQHWIYVRQCGSEQELQRQDIH